MPAAFTALMTATAAAAPPDRVRRAMGAYIAATIVGGFAGRAAGGFLTTAFGWQAPFLLLAALLVGNVVLASRLPEGGAPAFSRPRAAVLRAVVAKGHFLFSYLTIFCVFFVFAGVLNVLPFRLEAIEPGIREADIALVYSGYMIGIAAALGASRVSALLGGERRALAAALAVYLAATAGFAVPSVTVLLANVFLFSIGMFAVHSLLSALVNQRAAEARPVVNGMYIAVYYAGGSLGSWLPALAFGTIGWNALLAAMAAAVLAALWLTRYIFRADREEPGNG
ncbi:MAG: MFS transporter [Gammaproteobacteria bacterium]|nr:MFS transporter [Gammaproteobacteria bacterium]